MPEVFPKITMFALLTFIQSSIKRHLQIFRNFFVRNIFNISNKFIKIFLIIRTTLSNTSIECQFSFWGSVTLDLTFLPEEVVDLIYASSLVPHSTGLNLAVSSYFEIVFC